VDEALRICRARLDGYETAGMLGYLNIGLMAHEVVPPELPRLMEAARLRCVVHAVEFNLTGKLNPRIVARFKAALATLNPMWVEQDIGMWLMSAMYLGAHMLNPIPTVAVAATVADNVTRLAKQLETDFCIENPPVYIATRGLAMHELLQAILERCDCGLVLDVGHLIGAAINTDTPFALPHEGWPGWARIRELHFSAYEIICYGPVKVWADKHSLPFPPQLLAIGREAISYSINAAHICLELEGAVPQVVIDNLAAARAALQ
jgi:uncharacterized protein (UPF0276 family)